MARQLFLLATLSYTVALVIVSLVDLNGIPSLGSSFDDKIYHLLAYVILGYLWATLFKTQNSKITNWLVFVFVLLFGVVLELIQHKLNPNRSYDSYDLVANCLGSIIGILIAHNINVIKLK